jgi:hypothetical protein
MHALVDATARILSLAGMLHMDFPFFASIDRRESDLQDLLLNEPWFLIEGLLWGTLGWFRLASVRSRRLWVGSGLVATVILTVIGVLSTVLLPNHKLRGTQVSCPTLRERRRPVGIGEVLAVVLELQLIDTEGRGHALGCISIGHHKM